MLNAYISKDEILKLLESSECINGMINKREFQQAILEIKEHKKPKKNEIEENEIEKNCHKQHIRGARNAIGNIIKYQNAVKRKDGQKDVIEKICSLFNIPCQDKDIAIFTNEEYLDESYNWARKKERIGLHRLAFNRYELMKILNISKPTFLRWEKIGIIKRKYLWFTISLNNEMLMSDRVQQNIIYREWNPRIHIFDDDEECRKSEFYDLEEIKMHLKNMI